MNEECLSDSTYNSECYTCSPGSAGCYGVPTYRRYFASEYGVCSGYDNMKAELMRGPISCGVDANQVDLVGRGVPTRTKNTPLFCRWKAPSRKPAPAAHQAMDDYTGGIFSSSGNSINHIVSLFGWGLDPVTGDEYWL